MNYLGLPMDLQAAFRDPGSKGDSRNQCLMRFAVKHRGSRDRSTPALRGSGPVQNPLRSPRMGRRPDGESPQLTLVEEVAKNDRHPHSERISNHILRISVRGGGVPTVRVTGPCAPMGVRTPEGPGLGRAYAVHRQPAGPRRRRI